MHLLVEPSQESVELSGLDLVPYVGDVLDHRVPKLDTDEVAEGVGGEVSLDAHRPVDVLHAAVGVRGHVDAQVALVLLVPQGRYLVNAHLAVHHRQLHLETDEDVQVVGHLIGLHTDQGGLDQVGRCVEVLDGHGPHLAGEGGLELGVVVTPEGHGPAHDVLPHPGLGLVEAQTDGITHGGRVVLGVEALLVHGVSRLVDVGEQGGTDVVLVVPGGDAHIVYGTGGEGMGRLVQTSALPVVTDVADHHHAELLLLVQGPRLGKDAPVGMDIGVDDLLYDGHQPLPEVREDHLHVLGPGARLVLVDECVVQIVLVSDVLGYLHLEVDHLL